MVIIVALHQREIYGLYQAPFFQTDISVIKNPNHAANHDGKYVFQL